jgi:ribosomal-protein-serine acetyltransferase
MTPGELLPLDLGDGLVLHEATADDAPEVYAAVDGARDRLREWLPWVDATDSLDVQRDFLASSAVANDVGSALNLTPRQDGDVAGQLGLRIDARHATAEVGYWLASEYVGRGLMTRSVAALIGLAFGPLGLHRVQLNAATGNLRSRAIAERLGMRHEGTLRDAELLARGHVDLEVYAVLSTEWTATRA